MSFQKNSSPGSHGSKKVGYDLGGLVGDFLLRVGLLRPASILGSFVSIQFSSIYFSSRLIAHGKNVQYRMIKNN